MLNFRDCYCIICTVGSVYKTQRVTCSCSDISCTASWFGFPLTTPWLTLWYPRLIFLCYVCITVRDMNTVHDVCIRTPAVAHHPYECNTRRVNALILIECIQKQIVWVFFISNTNVCFPRLYNFDGLSGRFHFLIN